MGLSVAKLLAKKGASVVIVARGVEKLKAALAEISVRTLCNTSINHQAAIKALTKTAPHLVFSRKPPNPALPLHKRRPQIPHRIHSDSL
jgi:NAD(P)-dependent dehydrogenase (short-subunit alcohol dehydrogenase family)